MSDNWTNRFEKFKNRKQNAAKKQQIENDQKQIDDKLAQAKKERSAKYQYKNAKGFKAKVKVFAKTRKQGVETKLKKVLAAIMAAARFIGSFIRRHLLLLLIVIPLCIVCGFFVIFWISLTQAIGDTPHYYCDLDASPNIKNSAVYKQYCTQSRTVFSFENLTGHYVVQDGSGPCSSCSTLNMIIRYYTYYGINIYEYLWQENGQYTLEGQNVHETRNTLRKAINTSAETSCTCGSWAKGSKYFAKLHGKGSDYKMANWGYYSDNSLDIAEWDQTGSVYIEGLYNKDGWVFDLSLECVEHTTADGVRYGANTSWATLWEPKDIVIGGIPLKVKHESGSQLNADYIAQLLDSPDICGAAGIHVFYGYPKPGNKDGQHGILITGYEGDGDNRIWYVVDPGKGLAGGFEGPLNSSTFALNSEGLTALFKSGGNLVSTSSGNYYFKDIVYCYPATGYQPAYTSD